MHCILYPISWHTVIFIESSDAKRNADLKLKFKVVTKLRCQANTMTKHIKSNCFLFFSGQDHSGCAFCFLGFCVPHE
jgi:hypothetical protein